MIEDNDPLKDKSLTGNISLNASQPAMNNNASKYFNEQLVAHKRKKIIDDQKANDNDDTLSKRASNRSKSRTVRRNLNSQGSKRSKNSSYDEINASREELIIAKQIRQSEETHQEIQKNLLSDFNTRNVAIMEEEREDTTINQLQTRFRDVQVQQQADIITNKMPEVLTQSWEKAIRSSTKQFVQHLIEINNQQPNIVKNEKFKRGATRFIAKRYSTEQSEEAEQVPFELTQSWEESILQATHEFVQELLQRHLNQSQQSVSAFQRGNTVFISKQKSKQQLSQGSINTISEEQEENTSVVNLEEQVLDEVMAVANLGLDEGNEQQLMESIVAKLEQIIIGNEIVWNSNDIELELQNNLIEVSYDKIESTIINDHLKAQTQIINKEFEQKFSNFIIEDLMDQTIEQEFDEQVTVVEQKIQELVDQYEQRKKISEDQKRIEEEKKKLLEDQLKIQEQMAQIEQEQLKIQQERQKFLEEQEQIELQRQLKLQEDQRVFQQMQKDLEDKKLSLLKLKSYKKSQISFLNEDVSDYKSKSILEEVSMNEDLPNEKSVISQKYESDFIPGNTDNSQANLIVINNKISKKEFSMALVNESQTQQIYKSDEDEQLDATATFQDKNILLEEALVESSLITLEQRLFKELYKFFIEHLKQDMYDKFIDSMVDKTLNIVLPITVQEEAMQLENKFINYLSDKAVNQCESQVVSSLAEMCQQNESNLADQQITFQQLQNSQKQEKVVSKGTLQKVKVIKKAKIKKISNFNQTMNNLNLDQVNQEPQPSQWQRVKTQEMSSRPISIKDMKIQDLLDIEFFEKCFFGKKLLIKDQVVFRIYANELLELIKSNLNKDLRRKYKQFKEQRRNMKINRYNPIYDIGQVTNRSERKKIKSRSPIREFDPSVELEGYKMIANFRQTLTPEPERQRQIDYNDSTEKTILNINLPENINIKGQKTRKKKSKGQSLDDSKGEGIIPIINFQPNPDDTQFQHSSDTANFNPMEIKNGNQSVPEQSIFQNQALNLAPQPSEDQQQTDEYSKTIKIRRKKQPSQVKISQQEVTDHKGRSISRGTYRIGGQLSPPKNLQLKVYQNLETSIKDILRQKNSAIKQIRAKRRIINHSERVTPTMSPTNSNHDYSKQMSNYRNQLAPGTAEQDMSTPVSFDNSQHFQNSENFQNMISNQKLTAEESQGMRQRIEKNQMQQRRSSTPQMELDVSEDYRKYKQQNELDIIAISNPKKRIGEIIEKARHFVRIGDESDKPQYVCKAEGRVKDHNNINKKQQSNLRPSSHMRTQDNRPLELAKIDPFIQEFIKDKRISHIIGAGKQYQNGRSKSKKRRQIEELKAMNKTAMTMTVQNSPVSTIMNHKNLSNSFGMYNDNSYANSQIGYNNNMANYEEIKKNLKGRRVIVSMHEKQKQE
ncbi:UNKNOWN [Stylonychia lemnae]|uniref:Uncharacterized protein n=1 Tax=Stylonychia lemnae TaxID=5949 RepID=A0A078AA96_STYLE|nr:UNKNOWN [Stylonychia lemnae]|eukprot:CDW79180.1 UNKNOWN [Stylonychia lemnae]